MDFSIDRLSDFRHNTYIEQTTRGITMKAIVAYNTDIGQYQVQWPDNDYPVDAGPSLDVIAMECDAQGIGFEYTGRFSDNDD